MPNKMTKNAKCTVCGDTVAPDFRPFCGKGCRDRDLLKWLGESYRVPGPPAQDMAEKSDQNGLDNDI
jgi:uncharacterized protein